MFRLLQKTKSVINISRDEAECRLERVRELVSKIAGVFHTETNHINDTLTIEYDRDRVTLDRIRFVVKEAQHSTC
jgi:hypothetical protein